MAGKTVDDTRNLVRRLCDDLEEGRRKVSDWYSDIRKYPISAHRYGEQITRVTITSQYRALLLKYLTKRLSRDRLEYDLRTSLVFYLKKSKRDVPRSMTKKSVSFIIDYLTSALDPYEEGYSLDLILSIASSYPQIDTVEEAFTSDTVPEFLSKMEDDPEGDQDFY